MPVLVFLFFIPVVLWGQSRSENLDKAVKQLLSLPESGAAQLSFYVTDKKGNPVYRYNENIGLSPASTQKIFTAICMLDTFGKDYRYKTSMAYSGKLNKGGLMGDLFIQSSGDPSLGSWRYEGYKVEDFKRQCISTLKDKGIKEISGSIWLDDSYFDFQSVPGGWPWNDMGNYYGAGVWGINWRENRFDLILENGIIKSTSIKLPKLTWYAEIVKEGTADKSIVYTAPYSPFAFIKGKLPPNKKMVISGANPLPPLSLGSEIKQWLRENSILFDGEVYLYSQEKTEKRVPPKFPEQNIILTYYSPPLDRLLYYFMQESINLYGETFVKTLGKEKLMEGSFISGLTYLKSFWVKSGLSPYSINFLDGSGLSPQNYISAKAQVQALLWSIRQSWFPEFLGYLSPYKDGIYMKSGTIKNTKSYAGFYKDYVFSITINNYQGTDASSALLRILQELD
ncbi:MAG: D-alanyl-D-alanine carboxypeptidase/D-alanyl-D-alanine-endopeptidase [Bergeyella sp.]|nr:D-alanyl-D-alanine carboxypeptidase/D-alanyl-D-alanine-endopeptidase [Bergeyella sp.]